MDDPAPAPHQVPDGVNEFVEPGPFGPYRVDDLGGVRPPRPYGQPGQVVDVNRTQPVRTGAADGEHRQAAQQPGDVVDQDAALAEEDRGAKHRVRNSRLRERSFHACLPAKVRVGRVDRRVRDADVHDALDACATGSVEQCL